MKIVSAEEFDRVLSEIDAEKAMRAEKMPTEADALAQMFEAYQRLIEMGWSDAVYCPKDESMFSAIEAGSTGVHKCNYVGSWPTGHWRVYDGDIWPSRPILWRPRKPDDPEINKGFAMDYHCCQTPNTSTHADSDGTGYCRGCGTTIGESHHADCDIEAPDNAAQEKP